MDRNAAKVRAFADRRKLQEFEAAVGQGRVAVLDGIGRPIRGGDLICVQALPSATIFRVAEAEPILADPRMVGAVRVILQTTVEIVLPSGHPQPGLLIIDPIESQIAATAAAGEISAEDAAQAVKDASAPPPALSPIVLTDGDAH